MRWLNGFRYALEGIAHAVMTERHMQFHVAAAALAAALGAFSRLNRDEWLWITVAITLVWMAECFNTAVERAVNRMGEDRHPLSKAAKDTAAGAVFIASFFALIVGILVLLPALWERLLPLLTT